MKKLLAPILLLFCSCTWTNAHKPQLAATGSYLAKRAAGIAFHVIINAAVSQSDASNKADFLDSAALGLRTHALDIASGEDVATFVKIWTPDKPHWAELSGKLADEIKRAGSTQQAVEAVAAGLNLAAASERQP